MIIKKFKKFILIEVIKVFYWILLICFKREKSLMWLKIQFIHGLQQLDTMSMLH